jgi:hypothetical protein
MGGFDLSPKYLASIFALSIVLLTTILWQPASLATVNPVSSSISPSIAWEQTYSPGVYGIMTHTLNLMIPTNDGGYALAGWAIFLQLGAVGPWLVKVDSSGNEQWKQLYFTEEMNINLHQPNSIVQTTDGGYALAGGFGNGTYLVKTDSQGKIQWRQNYIDVNGLSLIETGEGGFVMVGYKGNDCWLAKTNSSGQIQWTQTYVAKNVSEGMSILQTTDGGYAILGMVNPYTVGSEAWLIETSSSGNPLWNRTYNWGGDLFEPSSLVETNDGGYAFAGGLHGGPRMVKTDSRGNVIWNQSYSQFGSGYSVYSVVKTSEGGYALGYEFSPAPSGNVIKIDSEGNLQWNISCNGTVVSIVQTNSGGYVFETTNFKDYNSFMGTTGSLTLQKSPSPSTSQSTSSTSPPSSFSPSPSIPELSNCLAVILVILAATTIFVSLKRKVNTSRIFSVENALLVLAQFKVAKSFILEVIGG